MVGRVGRDDDEVEAHGVKVRHFERGARGTRRHVRACLFGIGDVARFDPRALLDPVRVYACRLHQFGVGNDSTGEIFAPADDVCIEHRNPLRTRPM